MGYGGTMALSYADARRIGQAYLDERYPGRDLTTSPDGWQDPEAFVVPYGSRAWIEDKDPDALDFSLMPMLVDRDSGTVWFATPADEGMADRFRMLESVSESTPANTDEDPAPLS